MNKFLIISISIIGLLFLVGVILAAIAPKKIEIKTTKVIKASKEEVFDQIRYQKNFSAWSAWRVKDPKQTYKITGVDGEVGATYHWEGGLEKSKGYQTVAYMVGTDTIRLECTITEPFKSNPVFTYTLRQVDEGTQVTQHFENEMVAPVNIIAMLMGLKKQITEVNNDGMDLLKKVSEKNEITLIN